MIRYTLQIRIECGKLCDKPWYGLILGRLKFGSISSCKYVELKNIGRGQGY